MNKLPVGRLRVVLGGGAFTEVLAALKYALEQLRADLVRVLLVVDRRRRSFVVECFQLYDEGLDGVLVHADICYDVKVNPLLVQGVVAIARGVVVLGHVVLSVGRLIAYGPSTGATTESEC